jgi:beta-galactosidase
LKISNHFAGQEVHVLLTWVDTRDQGLVGQNMSTVSITLPVALQVDSPVYISKSPRRQLVCTGNEASGDGFLLRWDDQGRLQTYSVDDRILLAEDLGTTLWRAPTENDGIKAWYLNHDFEKHARGEKPLSRWMLWGLDACEHSHEATTVQQLHHGAFQMTSRYATWGYRLPEEKLTEERIITILPNGTLDIQHNYEIPQAIADLPRLGVAWKCPQGFDHMEWLGYGSTESYNDRWVGSPFGRYASAVRDRYIPYIMPQEHGNIHGLRWLALKGQDGAGLLMSATQPVDGKATQVSDATLTAGLHTTDVTLDQETTLHIDARQRGLGTKSCGPDTLPQYRLHAGRWS